MGSRLARLRNLSIGTRLTILFVVVIVVFSVALSLVSYTLKQTIQSCEDSRTRTDATLNLLATRAAANPLYTPEQRASNAKDYADLMGVAASCPRSHWLW